MIKNDPGVRSLISGAAGKQNVVVRLESALTRINTHGSLPHIHQRHPSQPASQPATHQGAWEVRDLDLQTPWGGQPGVGGRGGRERERERERERRRDTNTDR